MYQIFLVAVQPGDGGAVAGGARRSGAPQRRGRGRAGPGVRLDWSFPGSGVALGDSVQPFNGFVQGIAAPFSDDIELSALEGHFAVSKHLLSGGSDSFAVEEVIPAGVFRVNSTLAKHFKRLSGAVCELFHHQAHIDILAFQFHKRDGVFTVFEEKEETIAYTLIIAHEFFSFQHYSVRDLT